MGCYITTNDASNIEDVIAAICRRHRGAELLVVSNFNKDLDELKGSVRAEEIAAELATAGLENMSAHSFPRHKYWSRDGRTWIMRRGDRVVRSRTN